MRILFVNCVCGVGSTGRIVTDLMQEAKKQGHTVRVACSTVEPVLGVEPKEVFVVGSKLDYYMHNILSRITDHEGLFSKSATNRLIKQIREFDPDVVHLHNLHGHWINYEKLFKYLAEEKKRVVWTLHDCWAFTGHCSYFSSLKCEQWKSHCSYCRGLRGYPMCFGKGDVSSNYDRKKRVFTSVEDMTIVTPSEWLAELVKKSFFKDYTIKPIPNGIDLSIFRKTNSTFKKEHHIEDKHLILGVANVWSARKGYDDILQLRKMLNEGYIIVLVGLTKEQLADLPEGMIGILRTQNASELAEIYSAADVFVNPSYEETMGLVTAEAIACGTPAVVYDQTAVPEVVDSNSGIIVKAGDIYGLRNAIDYILSHKERYSNTIQRAYEFEKTKQYQQYLELFDRQ